MILTKYFHSFIFLGKKLKPSYFVWDTKWSIFHTTGVVVSHKLPANFFSSRIIPKAYNFSYRTPQYRQSNILLCLMAACQKDTFFPYAHIFHELVLIGNTILVFLARTITMASLAIHIVPSHLLRAHSWTHLLDIYLRSMKYFLC